MAAMASLSAPVKLASSASLAVKELKVPCGPARVACPQVFVVRATAEQGQARRRVVNIAAAAIMVGSLALGGAANAGLVEDLLAKSTANKALNDAKRLATSGANSSRPWTVELGTCRFPNNFTGCDDLARKENVAFITDDLKLECEGKEPGKCASNNLWNAKSKGLAAPGIDTRSQKIKS